MLRPYVLKESYIKFVYTPPAGTIKDHISSG